MALALSAMQVTQIEALQPAGSTARAHPAHLAYRLATTQQPTSADATRATAAAAASAGNCLGSLSIRTTQQKLIATIYTFYFLSLYIFSPYLCAARPGRALFVRFCSFSSCKYFYYNILSLLVFAVPSAWYCLLYVCCVLFFLLLSFLSLSLWLQGGLWGPMAWHCQSFV